MTGRGGRDDWWVSTSTETGECRVDIKSIIIGMLVVGVGVLGYLYYDAQQTKVKVDLPGIKIESK